MNEIDILLNRETVKTSEGEITLRAFRMKDFPMVLELVERYKGFFTDKGLNLAEIAFGKNKDEFQVVEDMANMVVISSNIEKPTLLEMPYDEVVGLVSIVVKNNMDFFTQKMESLNPKTSTTEEEEEEKPLPAPGVTSSTN